MIEFKKYEVVETCDLCGSKNIREYFKPGDIVKCDDCHFLFVSPRPSLEDIQNSYSDENFYDSWLGEGEGRLKMWQKRYSRIKQYIGAAINILDYSAGIGTFMQLAKLDGQNVFGTEFSASAKKISAEQYGIELFDTDYFFSSKYNNYFDAITAWHVVEHVISPKSLIENFYKVLKPGGLLFVAVPNAKAKSLKTLFAKQNMEQAFPKLTMGKEIHLSQFTTETLGRLLKSVGFYILHTGIDDHYPTQNIKDRLKHNLYLGIYNITRKNYSPTIFILTRKQ